RPPAPRDLPELAGEDGSAEPGGAGYPGQRPLHGGPLRQILLDHGVEPQPEAVANGLRELGARARLEELRAVGPFEDERHARLDEARQRDGRERGVRDVLCAANDAALRDREPALAAPAGEEDLVHERSREVGAGSGDDERRLQLRQAGPGSEHAPVRRAEEDGPPTAVETRRQLEEKAQPGIARSAFRIGWAADDRGRGLHALGVVIQDDDGNARRRQGLRAPTARAENDTRFGTRRHPLVLPTLRESLRP